MRCDILILKQTRTNDTAPLERFTLRMNSAFLYNLSISVTEQFNLRLNNVKKTFNKVSNFLNSFSPGGVFNTHYVSVDNITITLIICWLIKIQWFGWFVFSHKQAIHNTLVIHGDAETKIKRNKTNQ